MRKVTSCMYPIMLTTACVFHLVNTRGKLHVRPKEGGKTGLTLDCNLQARHAQLLKQAAARHFAASRWDDFIVVGEILAESEPTARAFSRLAYADMQLKDLDKAVRACMLTQPLRVTPC